MNVLGRVSSLLNNLDIVTPVLQPAVREIRLERTSVRGVARVAGQTHPSPFPRHPPHHRSAAAIKTPVGLTLAPPGLLLIPTLVSGDTTQRCVCVRR